MSLSQRVNVRANLLASEALMTAVESQTFIVPTFPTEGVSLSIGEQELLVHQSRKSPTCGASKWLKTYSIGVK
jgi:hypothetical protein